MKKKNFAQGSGHVFSCYSYEINMQRSSRSYSWQNKKKKGGGGRFSDGFGRPKYL